MRLIRLGLAQVNNTVGAVTRNTDCALAAARKMAEQGVTVGAFQEQLIGGYPTEDLVLWNDFVESQWRELLRFAEGTAALPTVFVIGLAVLHEGIRFNVAAVVAKGRVHGLVPKEKLPTYGVFYDGRTFGKGTAGWTSRVKGVPFGDLLFRFDFGVLATEVCEDLWSPEGPLRRRCYSGAELVVNLSASPFRVGVYQTRRELIATRAADAQCTLVYSNAVGANDGLIFDGGGFVNQNGKSVLDAPRFQEGIATATVDLDRTRRLRAENTTWRGDQSAFRETNPLTEVVDVADFKAQREGLHFPSPAHRSFFLPAPYTPRTARETLCEELLDALALGVADYYRKTAAFRCIGVALSGGRDSLLSLLIAHRAAKLLKPDAPGSLLHAFYMPSRFSSPETRGAAETICRDLGVAFEVVSIDEAFTRELEVVQKMLGAGGKVSPLTEQNIQARLRGQRMWNWSNSSGGLFLQTGNMSERAVGYTTVGGDLEGALAVIANLPKTVVMYLLDYLHEQTQLPGIAQTLVKPAGPELAPNQVGEEELMPFPVLDACFHLFAEEKLLPHEIADTLSQMFPERPAAELVAHVDKFARLFLQSIYKWVQAPLSLHVGNLDLDRERALQLPVVTKPEWTKKPAP